MAAWATMSYSAALEVTLCTAMTATFAPARWVLLLSWATAVAYNAIICVWYYNTWGAVASGVNGGSNVGEDLTYSGTVAAAMEATLLGIPAMALSQDFRDGEEPPWQTGEAFGPEVIRRSFLS